MTAHSSPTSPRLLRVYSSHRHTGSKVRKSIGGVAQRIERPGFYMSFRQGHGLEGRRFKSCRRPHRCHFIFDAPMKVSPDLRQRDHLRQAVVVALLRTLNILQAGNPLTENVLDRRRWYAANAARTNNSLHRCTGRRCGAPLECRGAQWSRVGPLVAQVGAV